MRQMEVAMAVIQQGEDFLLQRRKQDPLKGAAGMIGCFGGKIENELPAEAISREVTEETSLQPKPEEFKFLGTYKVVSDNQLEEVEVNISAFQLTVEQGLQVEAREGELLRMNKQQALDNLNNMTPGTRACFEKYVGEM